MPGRQKKELSPKTKKLLSWVLKIVIGIASFAFVYYKLKPECTPEKLAIVKEGFRAPAQLGLLLICFLLIPLNWALEIYKWQLITHNIEAVSFGKAAQSVLTGICLGNLTPGRLGEFAGRILFFNPINRAKVAITHFVCGLTQLLTTVSLGILGLALLLMNKAPDKLNYLILIACLLLFLALLFLMLKINACYKWLSGLKFLNRFSLGEINYESRTIRLLLGLSVLRYAVFSTQYFILLHALGAWGDVVQLYAAIAVSFMLMSSIPMISFIEMAIRGAIALLVFSSFHASALQLFVASTLLWLFNIILPSIVGYFIFLRKKTLTKSILPS